MGALLGTATGATSAASSAACCAGAMVCQAMTAFCKCASPAPATKASGKFSKVIYLFMILFSCVFALVMQNYGAPQIKMSYWTVGCSTVTDVAACKGDGAVYRISMGTFLWFAGLMLGTLVVNEKMHNGYWGPKILIYLIFVGGSFFIKNDVFGAGNAGGAIAGNSGYALFARIASSFFLIFQIVAFIDFAYKWNNSWVGKSNDLEEEEDGKGRKWLGAILAACAGMYIVFFIWIIYLFANYSNTDGPELMFICVTAIGVVVITGMQLSIAETDGSLLTSAVVSLYSVYLCWSAVSGANRTDSKSNPASVWLGFAVAAFSLTWTCYSASVSATTITSGPTAAEEEATEDLEEMRVPLAKQGASHFSKYGKAEGEEKEGGSSPNMDEDVEMQRKLSYGTQERVKERELEPIKERYWFFHAAMGAGSIYMAMLLTDWGTGGNKTIGGGGATSMWVKMFSQWFAMLLYTWTLVAPRFFPDRDFN
jgi:serine incorporator 1/3|eukprot:g3521.t1